MIYVHTLWKTDNLKRNLFYGDVNQIRFSLDALTSIMTFHHDNTLGACGHKTNNEMEPG